MGMIEWCITSDHQSHFLVRTYLLQVVDSGSKNMEVAVMRKGLPVQVRL